MPRTADNIAQILDLGHAYNHAVDTHDVDAWTATFVDNGEVESPIGNPRGRKELHDWTSNVVSNLTGTRHFSLNEVVAGDGNRATMRSYHFVVGTNDAPPAIGATGGYDNELIKLDGR